MKLLACNSNKPLAEAMASYLGTTLTQADVKKFPDSEVFVEIHENVRGEDVFLIQSTSNPANQNIMELLITLDALKRASARRVTAVIPYFGYARQDRKPGPRTPISAKLVANIMESAGVDRVLTLDLHAAQIQGFFDIPVDHLYARPVIVSDIKEKYGDKPLTVVSPDVGGVVRARSLAKRIEADLAIIDKRRERASVSEVMNVIGDVNGKHCLLFDDIVDTAGTLCNAVNALIEKGATGVSAYVTHGVLSGPAVERIENSNMDELVISDSILQPDAVTNCAKIRQFSIAPLLAEAVQRISDEDSVSSLFDDQTVANFK
jgi:ribose-phosphate pyrophosphokinase